MGRDNVPGVQGAGGGSGFPLFQPMLVILVILSLAALLVPQFGLARERARKALCVSNQRNLETAVAMWSTDNPSAVYVGGPMNASAPGFSALTGAASYTSAGVFKEPDDLNANNATGVDYYLSMGGPTGGAASEAAPSYGHVACAADQQPDPWVAGYDGALGSIAGINHTRGASASP